LKPNSAENQSTLAVDSVTELVDRCLDGQQDAIVEFTERFHSRVFGLCYRLVRHVQDAEDATQESFLRAIRSLGNWDSKRPLVPWLLAIAGNRCRTLLARRVRRPQLVTAEILERDQPLAAESGVNALEEELDLALTALREEHRQAFLLFHKEELSYEEIAAAMNRPVGTVQTWVHRARGQLASHFVDREIVAGSKNELR
jgi:RNA polymerase sigma-70 factor (ECF subfamily)